MEPGRESAFSLNLQSDDRDDDGVPDLKFNRVEPASDWRCTWLLDQWTADTSGGALDGGSWDSNPQFQLTLRGRTRVFIFLELTNVDDDARDEAGMQTTPD